VVKKFRTFMKIVFFCGVRTAGHCAPTSAKLSSLQFFKIPAFSDSHFLNYFSYQYGGVLYVTSYFSFLHVIYNRWYFLHICPVCARFSIVSQVHGVMLAQHEGQKPSQSTGRLCYRRVSPSTHKIARCVSESKVESTLWRHASYGGGWVRSYAFFYWW